MLSIWILTGCEQRGHKELIKSVLLDSLIKNVWSGLNVGTICFGGKQRSSVSLWTCERGGFANNILRVRALDDQNSTVFWQSCLPTTSNQMLVINALARCVNGATCQFSSGCVCNVLFCFPLCFSFLNAKHQLVHLIYRAGQNCRFSGK